MSLDGFHSVLDLPNVASRCQHEGPPQHGALTEVSEFLEEHAPGSEQEDASKRTGAPWEYAPEIASRRAWRRFVKAAAVGWDQGGGKAAPSSRLTLGALDDKNIP